jgi:hypothetical protein
MSKYIKTYKYGIAISSLLNKSVEAQILTNRNNEGFHYNLSLRTKGDHPGLRLSIDYNGYGFYFTANDCRHWNWDENRFYRDDED